MTRKTFWIGTIIVALCGLSVSAAIGLRHPERSHPTEHFSAAAWKEKYRTTDELIRRVDGIVLAQAVAATPGRVAYSANGEDALPFEVVEFRVVDGIKNFKTGDQVFVERAGGTDSEGNRRILEAVQSRDPDAAERAMAEHIEDIASHFRPGGEIYDLERTDAAKGA